MSREELLDRILEAGTRYDGHVTNGSASGLADLFEALAPDPLYSVPKSVEESASHDRSRLRE